MSSPVFTAFHALIKYENAKAREAKARAATKRARARLTAARHAEVKYVIQTAKQDAENAKLAARS